jgi:hypothetical protein
MNLSVSNVFLQSSKISKIIDLLDDDDLLIIDSPCMKSFLQLQNEDTKVMAFSDVKEYLCDYGNTHDIWMPKQSKITVEFDDLIIMNDDIKKLLGIKIAHRVSMQVIDFLKLISSSSFFPLY